MGRIAAGTAAGSKGIGVRNHDRRGAAPTSLNGVSSASVIFHDLAVDRTLCAVASAPGSELSRGSELKQPLWPTAAVGQQSAELGFGFRCRDAAAEGSAC